MADLQLTMACGPYDRMEALRYGQVRPQGVDLRYLAVQEPAELFNRMTRNGEFDIAEMGCSRCVAEGTSDSFPFVALPVFPSKVFRHGFIFVNTDAGIEQPKDLEGKRVGVPVYGQSAAIWIRGILQSEYGVALDTIKWYEGRTNSPGGHRFSGSPPYKQVSLSPIPADKTLSGMLEAGELDAVLGAQAPDSFGSSPRVRRLIPNYREVEQEYYRKTGIFPIMHTVVIKREVYQAHPWLAKSLYEAMEESKRVCLDEMKFSGAMRYALPWLYDDLDEMRRVFGDDPWSYGLEANRKNLETMQGYMVDQGLAKEARPLEEVFAPIIEAGV